MGFKSFLKKPKIGFWKTFLNILFGIKNHSYKRIFSLVGTGVGEIQYEISENYKAGKLGKFNEFLKPIF